MPGGSITSVRDAAASFNREELEQATAAKATTLGVPYFDIRNIEIKPDVLSLVSRDEAQKGVLPFERKGDQISVGVADTKSETAKAIVENLSNYLQVNLYLISWDAIKDVLPQFEGLTKQTLKKDEDYEIEAIANPATFSEMIKAINAAPLQDILKYIVTIALKANASDIHLEPQKDGARMRIRVDGVLHVVGNLTAERFQYVLSQIELTASMKLNTNEAQEGRIEIKVDEKNISVRVETMPTLYGDDISLRIFNTEAAMLNIADLGLFDYDQAILEKTLARPQGMILTVGPTGAGKTSTNYAILNALNKPDVKVITIEDPIEYALPGVTQSQINEGESFDERLKAVLREDPDIVMVGEIRDAATANVAIHAALTGHVMVSTFHAYNAPTALTLLRDVAADTSGSLLASSINLIIAQRLVRRLCPNCKEKYQPTKEELEFAKKIWEEIPQNLKTGKKAAFYHSKGCENCKNLGFSGRIGIFEMLPMNVELQKLVSRESITVQEVADAAQKSGMITMEQDGLLKAIDGETSLSEVMKVIRE